MRMLWKSFNSLIFDFGIVLSNTLIQEFLLFRSSRPEMFCKKDVLRNFAKFTVSEYFLIKLQASFSYRTPLVAASVCCISLAYFQRWNMHSNCINIVTKLRHIRVVFFLIAIWLFNFGSFSRDNITNLMLITPFWPEGHRELYSKVGPLNSAQHLVGFKPGTCRF